MAGLTFSLAELVAEIDGELHGDVDVDMQIQSIATLKDATAQDISFLSNAHYKQVLSNTQAGAVLVSASLLGELKASCPLIAVKDPYLAYATLQQKFHPMPVGQGNVHPTAIISETADIASDVDIAAGCVIDDGCVIGAGTVLLAACLIAKGVNIGKHCFLHAGVKIEANCQLGNRVIVQAGVVIGSDGFGYAWSGQAYVKIPQVGRVVVHDDVEIGANTCIDRGALGDTIIHQGVKLDNLVHIAHNVEIGALSAIAGQVGISGSSKIGQGCQMGGQVGVAGHLTIADGCQLAGKAGVISDIDKAGVYSGFPAMPHRQWLRMSALMSKLPDVWKKLKGKE
ncbi:MAG: UDP-3-O-(3-hydroxymyristoyl)glucosamine N-acyltransferase [Mariprofundaceae bacterium]|nr:UDP-3-O-(3-hydroxymyristoyl)glucosamine N-acyltransferase [Mariprofundaceae bacterium]